MGILSPIRHGIPENKCHNYTIYSRISFGVIHFCQEKKMNFGLMLCMKMLTFAKNNRQIFRIQITGEYYDYSVFNISQVCLIIIIFKIP